MKLCQRCNKVHGGAGTKWCDACKIVVTREQRNAQMRRYYSGEIGKARLRARKKDPKHEHNYRARRLMRAAQADDGTVTGAFLRTEFGRTHCPYCVRPMSADAKQLDHMQPLSLGGTHSARNVVVCCASCNRQKSNLPLVDWLAALPIQQAEKCRALWIKRNGAPPEQQAMAMPDPAVVVRRVRSIQERITRDAIAEAKRARAAWFKQDAPDEWMAAWYEASGKPWNNPRLTEAQRYRLKYNGNPAYKASQQAKVRRWKQANRERVQAQQARHAARKQCCGARVPV